MLCMKVEQSFIQVKIPFRYHFRINDLHFFFFNMDFFDISKFKFRDIFERHV